MMIDYHFTDFTEENYRKLISMAAANYRQISYAEAFDAPDGLLWRHDIDYSVHRAYALAEIEKEIGLRAHYFVQLHSPFYSILEKETSGLLRKIASGGHSVGLHFDPSYFDFPFGDQGAMEDCLQKDKRLLEDVLDCEIAVFSFHNPDVGGDWSRLPARTLGGMINVYCTELWERFSYCSDSNGYWRFQRLEDVLLNPPQRLHVLTHPSWWQTEAMPPRQRIQRCVYGRADAVMKTYDDTLKEFGRVNVNELMHQRHLFRDYFRPIKTERLVLRPICEDDLDNMYSYTSNPEVTKYVSWMPKTREETKTFIDQTVSNYEIGADYLWGIALAQTNELIGAAHLFEVDYKNRQCEISYIMNPRFQKCGYASEAVTAIIKHCLQNMNMQRVCARCDTENRASERTMQKSGMTFEGVLRQSFINKGVVRDMKLYAITLQ